MSGGLLFRFGFRRYCMSIRLRLRRMFTGIRLLSRFCMIGIFGMRLGRSMSVLRLDRRLRCPMTLCGSSGRGVFSTGSMFSMSLSSRRLMPFCGRVLSRF